MSQALYGVLQDHADAMLEPLRAELASPGPIPLYPAEAGGPTTVPNGAAPPYVVAHFMPDYGMGDTLDMRSTRFRMRAYAHCVGANDEAARGLADRVRAAWLDLRPAVPGRTSYPVRFEIHRPQPPDSDESTGRATVTITVLYRLETVPGPSGS